MGFNPILSDYVAQCRAGGMQDAEIQQVLLQSGWTQEQIGYQVEATPDFSAAFSESNIVVPRPRKRRYVLPLILVLSILGIAAGTIAVAEAGYWPAFSRVYRKTALPLLWGGTNGNGAISLAKMLMVSSSSTQVQGKNTLALTLSAISPDKKVSLQPLAKTFADFGQTSDNGFLPTLPYTTTLSTSFQYDKNKGSQVSLDWDLGSLYTQGQAWRQYVPWVAQQVSFQAISLPKQKQGFLRSNLIPYKVGDEQKWLQFSLSDKAIQELSNPNTAGATVSTSDLELYKTLAEQLTEDKGIERKDGAAFAHYRMVLNPTNLLKLAQSSVFAKYRADIEQAAKGDFLLTIDLYIEPRSGYVRMVDMVGYQTEPFINLKIGINAHQTFEYLDVNPVATPARSITIQDGLNYGKTVFMSAFQNISL